MAARLYLRKFTNLIRQMSLANPLWDAPRIHGELLKMGIGLCQATVAEYMARHRQPSQPATFLHNHTKDLVSLDFFVVPTITFQLLFRLVILSHNGCVRARFSDDSSEGLFLLVLPCSRSLTNSRPDRFPKLRPPSPSAWSTARRNTDPHGRPFGRRVGRHYSAPLKESKQIQKRIQNTYAG